MNLYLTKISRSYVKGVMRYQGGGTARPPWYPMWVQNPWYPKGYGYQNMNFKVETLISFEILGGIKFANKLFTKFLHFIRISTKIEMER